MSKPVLAGAILMLTGVSLLAIRPAHAAKKFTIKLATLAPEGSTWWKIFKEADQRLRALTDGRVKFRIYAGGVAGDEPDVVRKMRVGQLHAAAITSVGLAEIQPAMLVLQAPGLVRSWDELDHLRHELGDKLAALLAEKGYLTLLWGDVGFNRVFSNVQVKTPDDLKSTKPWCWTEDGVFQAWFAAIGAKPVLVGVPEVLSGLQTGLLNAYVTAPLAAVSLQWFNRSTYMLDHPINVTIGAVVLSKKTMDKLSNEDQAFVMQVGREFTGRLATAVRADNEKAVAAIRRAGIQITEADADVQRAWADVANKGADRAAGKVYPPELLAEARRIVAVYRASRGQ